MRSRGGPRLEFASVASQATQRYPNTSSLDRGSALLVALIVVVIVFGLAATMLGTIGVETRATGSARDGVEALYVAETGVNLALVELARGVDPDGDGLGTIARTFGSGSFTVAATASGTATVLRSRGSVRGQDRSVEATVEPATTTRFTHALTAGRQVIFQNNSYVDSYNSNLGTYISQQTGNHNGNPLALYTGNVRGNTGIKLQNTSGIYGNATPGPSGTVIADPGTVITGSTTPGADPVMPPLVIPPTFASGGAILLNGTSTRTIGPGDAGFDSVTFDDDTRLTIRGPARIEVKGDFNMWDEATLEIDATAGPVELYVRGMFSSLADANFVSSSLKPRDFSLVITGALTALYESNTGFYGTIYAPGTDITIGGSARVHGAIVGRTIRMKTSARVHYDTQLVGLSLPLPGYRVIVWKELVPGT